MIYSDFKNINCVVLDVDGVLTNGDIFVTELGEQLRTFNVKDGYAIQYAIKQGLHIFVITGAKSQGVYKRFEGLGVEEIHLGISDKWSLLSDLLDHYNFTKDELMVIGDDMPDYICMQHAKIAIAPADAAEDIKSIAHMVSKFKGGEGVVRDVLEKMLKLKGLWHNEVGIRSI